MTDNRAWRQLIFATHVQRLRKQRGWSQAELGRRLGDAGHPLKQSRIAAIEMSGSVTLDQAQAFADVFQVPIETLLYTEPPNTTVVQIQRLLQISNAVDRLRDDLSLLIKEIMADLPGELPPNVAVNADSVIILPSPLESE